MDAEAFLKKYRLHPDCVDTETCVSAMLQEMQAGLEGESSIKMLPSFLSNGGGPRAEAVAVDAGGTRLRAALVPPDGKLRGLVEREMPGARRAVTFDEFISAVAGLALPLMQPGRGLGFCFSYPSEITPERDGRLLRLTKEVRIDGAEGRLICAALRAKLAETGMPCGRTALLNDTVAVLLSAPGASIGMIAGTGANVCCELDAARIVKLEEKYRRGRMIVNMETGGFDKAPCGELDERLDAVSDDPGCQRLEKLISGAYLGRLASLALSAAASEGVPVGCPPKALTSPEADAMINSDAPASAREIVSAIFRRSGKLMACVIAATARLTGTGTKARPAAVAAEGSLYANSAAFREALKEYLTAADTSARFITGKSPNLLGAAAATQGTGVSAQRAGEGGRG